MASTFDRINLLTEKKLRHDDVGGGQKPDAHGQRNLEPLKKAHLFVVGLFHKPHEDAVRRRTDQGDHTAEAGAVGNGQQKADIKVVFPHIGRIELTFAAHHTHDGNGNRQHHGGGGGVAHPSRQKRRCQHHAQNDLLRARAHDADREKRNAAVKTPAGNTCGNQKAAHKEVDRAVGVVLQRFSGRGDPEKRKDYDGQKRRDCNRHGFGKPPDAHPEHDGSTGAARMGKLCGLARGRRVRFRQDEVKGERQKRAQNEGYELGLVA